MTPQRTEIHQQTLNTIAYLVYGSGREYHLELSYSVASALRFIGANNNAWRIVLICDESNRRHDLPVEHLIFSAEEFAGWTEGGKYKHAAKIGALAKAVACFGGKMALVDTDTAFVADPQRLFDRVGPGRTAMQAHDGVLGNFPEWRALIDQVHGTAAGYEVDRSSLMLNSGVVSIDATDRALLVEVKHLMTVLYQVAPIFNIEQFAYTAVLSRHTTLVTCEDTVAHYWGRERRFVHAHLAALLPEFNRARFDALADSFISLGYPKKRRLDQLRAYALGRMRGLGGDYRFAYLAYRCALSCTLSSPIDADAWARVAADTLLANTFPGVAVEKDFGRWRDDSGRDWMTPSTAAAWRAVWAAQAAGSAVAGRPAGT